MMRREPPTGTTAELRDCEFKTFFSPAAAVDDPFEVPVGCAIVVWGGQPYPLSRETLDRAVEAHRRGQTVALGSDRADLRDFAKRELMDALKTAGFQRRALPQPRRSSKP